MLGNTSHCAKIKYYLISNVIFFSHAAETQSTQIRIGVIAGIAVGVVLLIVGVVVITILLASSKKRKSLFHITWSEVFGNVIFFSHTAETQSTQMSIGIIAVIAVGVVLLIVLLIVGVVVITILLASRKKRKYSISNCNG